VLLLVLIVAGIAGVLCLALPGDLGGVELDVYRAAVSYGVIWAVVLGLLIGGGAQHLHGRSLRYRPKASQGEFVASVRRRGGLVFALGFVASLLITFMYWGLAQDMQGIPPNWQFLGIAAAGTAAIGLGYMLGCSMKNWGGSYAYWRKPRKI
jgi:hypothetical protein